MPNKAPNHLTFNSNTLNVLPAYRKVCQIKECSTLRRLVLLLANIMHPLVFINNSQDREGPPPRCIIHPSLRPHLIRRGVPLESSGSHQYLVAQPKCLR